MTKTHVVQIAELFARELNIHLGEAKFAEMQALNRTPAFAEPICASHNYVDANDVMNAAFVELFGRDNYLPSDVDEGRISEALHIADMALRNAAWAHARKSALI